MHSVAVTKAADEASGREPASGPDPVIEASKRGIDRTLLLENLKKTPHERVLALIALQRLARAAREAGARLRGR
jgi:hypothetical protein